MLQLCCTCCRVVFCNPRRFQKSSFPVSRRSFVVSSVGQLSRPFRRCLQRLSCMADTATWVGKFLRSPKPEMIWEEDRERQKQQRQEEEGMSCHVARRLQQKPTNRQQKGAGHRPPPSRTHAEPATLTRRLRSTCPQPVLSGSHELCLSHEPVFDLR